MPRVRSLAWSDAGNALVEFVYLALLLMVPLVYVLLTVFRVQGAAYAVSGAAREAGRVYVVTTPAEEAPSRALAAASLVMSDAGLSLDPDQLALTCSNNPCRTPGGTVDVTIDYTVALPFLPRFLSGGAPASVRVNGRHLEVVDRFRALR
jgi:Flp pilus assembly protein TadG